MRYDMKATPALEKAKQFLELYLSEVKGHRLPSIQKLARHAHVSPVTMWKAVRRYGDDGKLMVEKGGISIPRKNTGFSFTSETDETVRKWEWLASQLKSAILQRVYAAGGLLPSPKELTRQYGVSFRTLKKALNVLVNERLIVPYKKTYRIKPVHIPQRFSRLVLVTRADPLNPINESRSRAHALYSMLEIVCTRARCSLSLYIYRPSQNTSAIMTGFPPDENILGYLVWTSGMTPDDLKAVCAKLTLAAKPVSFLDESGITQQCPSETFSRNGFRIFSLSNTAASSAKVAQYLIDQGHRSVAYISPFHESAWSQSRLDGLVDTFANAGYRDCVIPAVFSRPLQDSVINDTVDYILATARYFSAIRNYLKRVYTNRIDEVLEEFRKNMEELTKGNNVRENLHHLFETALQNRKVTTWVMCNDRAAEEALKWLALKKINVPSGISLISFDDSDSAFFRNLTSYNFNISSLIEMMVSHILEPGNRNKGIVEVEGFVNVRQSVKKIG